MSAGSRDCPPFPPGAGTLLVLGSKPNPSLPPPESYRAVACANASGFSARALGLPAPRFTVASAVLGSGKGSDEHSLRALRGVPAGTLYLLPRPLPHGLARRALFRLRHWRMQTPWVRLRLKRAGLCFERVVAWPIEAYHALILELTSGAPEVRAAMARKRPSTGMVALAVGLTEGGFGHAILAGFDFSLHHAYGHNPLIDRRGTDLSAHADTDIAILRAIQRHRPILWTSEPAVHERTGLPLLPAR
jgi:hypothetical protein